MCRFVGMVEVSKSQDSLFVSTSFHPHLKANDISKIENRNRAYIFHIYMYLR